MKSLLRIFALNIALLSIFSANAIEVEIKNDSDHNAWIKFTGDGLTVSQNNVEIAAKSKTSFDLTNVQAGRIYISYDKPLSTNAPDGANPSDPDYKTRFDKVELTYNQAAGGKANLTAVDFYGIPFLLETVIDGTTIDHLTLAPETTGNDVALALVKSARNRKKIIIPTPNKIEMQKTLAGNAAPQFVRILAPVKIPEGYKGFDRLLKVLSALKTQFQITGTYFGTPAVDYDYTGFVGKTNITLTEGANEIVIPISTLQFSPTDTLNHNAIYTCNGPFTVNGVPSTVGDNTVYSAVYRDLITAFNLGFVKPNKILKSQDWFGGESIPFANPFCNKYAKQIAMRYPGAYGFPFSDRYKHILADLGGSVDLLKITILDDKTKVSRFKLEGNENPQTGNFQFNMILISENPNFNGTSFTFDQHSYRGGDNYNFPETKISSGSGSSQVNQVPAQEGLNIYDLEIARSKYQVLLNIENGVITWGSIAGGADATLSGNNLFVGGVF